MRYLIFFIFSSLFGHTINGKLDSMDLDYVKNKKVINVCINPDWEPIEFRESKIPKGISIDILRYISKNLGLKLNFITTKTWSESQEFLKQGRCDITPTAIKTSKREKYAIFTRAYLEYDLAVITTEDKPYVTNLNAILDKTITRKKGSGVITKLKRLYPNIDIIKAETYKQMFDLVSKKKVYATIATLPVFAYYKKKYNLTNLKVAGFTGWKYPLRIMVNKNERMLRKILDNELKFITPQTTQKIYEKWIVKTKPNTNYKKILEILIVLVVILFFILVWIVILHKKNKELNKLSHIKSTFLENMSHEIRTPLNAIIGFIQVLQKEPKKVKQYLPLIDGASQTLLIVIDNLLNFSRLEKNNFSLKKSEFSSKELEDIIYFYQNKIEQKGIKFNKTIKLPKKLEGDIVKIKNIIFQLLDNALKFTRQGEISVVLKVEKSKLFFSVKDTGIGIDKDKSKSIFKSFVQIDDRVNKEYCGVGIGLSISKKLVEFLGGELNVQSSLNKGSIFSFAIPIVILKEENFHNHLNKVLVVEDNKANQMFIKVILNQLKVKVDLAENGLEALKMYKKYNYSLILMDINMPIMDGITATKEIRKYEKENNLKPTKIVAVTAQVIDGDEEKFLKIMDGYISKPIEIEKLKQILTF